MNNQRIIEILDEIDNYLIKSVDESGKIINSQDIYARTHIANMQGIRKYLEENGIKGAIRNRVEQTENALLYATNRAQLNPDNKYFDWINSKNQQTDYTKPDDIQLYYDISTGHRPIVLPNYAREYLPNILGKEELLHGMEMLEQEYEKFINQDKAYEKPQETALVVRRRNPIQRFFDKILRRGEYSKKQSSVERNSASANEDYKNRHREYCEKLSNYENYSNEYQEPKQQQQPEQVIAISDLHGNMQKWQEIKKQMATNPNMKLLILGDAMDRGGYGLEILLQIKELCDQGKAEYLPGNHDVFAYNYMKTQEILSRLSEREKMQNENIVHIAGRELAHLERNGGETTLESLENFDTIVRDEIKNGNIKYSISKKELIDWLGKQPIQKKTKINNTTYALAHAYFDDELYNANRDFNLEQALQIEMDGRADDNTLEKFRTIMWYREHDVRTHYSPVTFPKGCVMVVGHTPQKEGINAKRFSKGEWDEQVIYIDTGSEIAAFDLTNGRSLEYQRNNEYR